MALIEDELNIIYLKNLLDMKLTLPPYQRPYKWSVKSTNTLFIDTYEAFKDNINEYRLGSIILHKEGTEKYNIVDGQQRLTTLSILLYCLGEENHSLLKEKYSKMSNNAIITNYGILYKRVNELASDEKHKYKEYLLNQCTTVKIVTDKENEAFQFFDSQNSRGKELAPHDLLKSYHLREMTSEDENQKIKVINRWENLKQDDLNDLFKNYLYPLTQWYKGKDGLGYSSSEIYAFKGIKGGYIYNYAIYHKASNLYVEQFNSNGSNELLASNFLNQFQLTQPLIAGKRFFYYTLHYEYLLETIKNKIEAFYKYDLIPSKRSGDIYIRQLYECTLLFFADRFGIENVTESVMDQLYSWSYSLRLTMFAVYPQTINKYAKGQHDRVNYGTDIFTTISEITGPEELKLLVLKIPDVVSGNKKKYKEIYKKLCNLNGWR
ncbi:DUF262 domain-containing protein [uncultured Ilyobacter sp.]|uniref:DUF262 domain-containing protein n=1 Tax=uncultured Ilyobacter sp. TaxID=544433 RepID=UPI002AA8046F|nr:DUF262 domain-containing protein [uncultured Ilyobacter sp.]